VDFIERADAGIPNPAAIRTRFRIELAAGLHRKDGAYLKKPCSGRRVGDGAARRYTIGLSRRFAGSPMCRSGRRPQAATERQGWRGSDGA
jgi:hypothetical protein